MRQAITRLKSSRSRRSIYVVLAVALTGAVLILLLRPGGRAASSAPQPRRPAETAVEATAARAGTWFANETSQAHGEADVALTGRLVDEAGRPLAGVIVCASCETCDLALLAEAPVCVQADENGRYVLPKLRGKYRISASAKGRAPVVLNGGRGVNPSRGEKLDGKMKKGGASISGVVKDVTGGVVAGAAVRANFTTQELAEGNVVSQQTVSDSQGAFALQVSGQGPVRLIAAADGYAPGDVTRMAPAEGVELILSPSSSISGVVVSAADKRPVPNVSVRATTQFGSGQQATSDAAGRFVIRQLKPGVYGLTAAGEGWRGEYPGTVTVDLLDEVESVTVPVYPARPVRGRLLVEPGDAPCPRGRVSLSAAAGNGTVPSLSELTDATGTVEFKSVPSGVYAVSLECEGYGRSQGEPFEVGPEGRPDMIWRIAARGTILAHAVDAEGRPVPKTELMLVPEGSPSAVPGTSTFRTELTDAQGNASYRSLPPGSYALQSRYLIEPVRVLVPPEKVEPVQVTVRLKPMGNIEVTVKSPKGKPMSGLFVSAVAADGAPGAPASEIGGGQYRIGPIAAGAYYVNVTDGVSPIVRAAGGGAKGELQLRGGETAKLEVEFGGYDGKISGRVLSGPDAPAPGVWVHAVPESFDPRDLYTMAQNARLAAEGRRVLTDGDGRFELTGLAETGSYWIIAERSLGGQAKKAAKPGDSVVILLEAPETVGGVVLDEGGHPVTRFAVMIANEAAGQQLNETFNDPGGRWTVTNVMPGKLLVMANDVRRQAKPLALELIAGRPLADVRLIVVEAAPLPPPASGPIVSSPR